MNDFMLATFGAAAEFERELISERVRDGMARARKENKKIGRPVVLEQKGIDALRLVNLRREWKSIREISQLVGDQGINSPWDPQIGVRKTYPIKSVDLFICPLSMFSLSNKEIFVGQMS